MDLYRRETIEKLACLPASEPGKPGRWAEPTLQCSRRDPVKLDAVMESIGEPGQVYPVIRQASAPQPTGSSGQQQQPPPASPSPGSASPGVKPAGAGSGGGSAAAAIAAGCGAAGGVIILATVVAWVWVAMQRRRRRRQQDAAKRIICVEAGALGKVESGSTAAHGGNLTSGKLQVVALDDASSLPTSLAHTISTLRATPLDGTEASSSVGWTSKSTVGWTSKSSHASAVAQAVAQLATPRQAQVEEKEVIVALDLPPAAAPHIVPAAGIEKAVRPVWELSAKGHKVKVYDLISHGSVGWVFSGFAPSHGLQVAVKVVMPDLDDREGSRGGSSSCGKVRREQHTAPTCMALAGPHVLVVNSSSREVE